MATIAGGHHIAFTVRDADRSAAFYTDLLGMQSLIQSDADDVRVRVLADPSSGWVIGLREYPGRPDGEFSEFRTGLDHFAFTVETRAELEAWQGVLEEKGVPHTPLAETPIGTVLVFRDPDNIQLEFWLPAGS